METKLDELQTRPAGENAGLDRRDFLKLCAVATSGLFLNKVSGWLNLLAGQKPPLKEARFYRRADHLAG
ncbi:MAG: twin-arginine translocation signal domain-containing protein [Candidatus Omnitrophica bacterium]|nr:twin-arginine translocation signal domain-containing protein [Candidatus Omnitrophota bacterium]